MDVGSNRLGIQKIQENLIRKVNPDFEMEIGDKSFFVKKICFVTIDNVDDVSWYSE